MRIMSTAEMTMYHYVQAATNLANSMRNDILHNDSKYSEATAKAFNEFVIQANAIKDFTDNLESEQNKYNN